MSLKLIAFPAPINARVNKILIAAAIAGIKVEFVSVLTVEDKEAWALNCHPQGASPVLQTEQGYLFESGAILRHIARLGKSAGLYGTTDFEASNVDAWIDFTTGELDTSTFAHLLHVFGVNVQTEEFLKGCTANICSALTGLDKWLDIRTFLVGERITIADIAVFASIDTFLRVSAHAGEIYKFKNLYRHYLTILHIAKVQEALKSVGHDGGIPAKPKAEAPAKPAAEPKKKEEKPAAKPAEEDEEEEVVVEKKKPNPLDSLPPSKFVLDAFKREYSNNDIRKIAAPYFFENFDNEGFTAFWCNYKYNSENKMQFMTANLVRGWFQRMEHVRKYAFGSVLICGEDKKHEITAFWVFRGKGLPEIVAEVEDSELYTWTEIPDLKAEAAKITDYLNWDGETFATNPVLEGRVFK